MLINSGITKAHKKRLNVLLAMLLASGFSASALANPAQIKQVVVGPGAGDSPNNFSLNITLINGSSTLEQWRFGFYMPRNFRQTSQSNRHLTMKVCQTGTANCTSMSYQKNPFLSPDLSTVFTTIVEPDSSFPLLKNKSYTLSFLHNSSRSPQNYSALPQSLFLIDGRRVVNLTTTPQSYHVSDFHPDEAWQKTQQRLQQNWQNSNQQNLNGIIIPAPAWLQFNSESARFNLTQPLLIHDLASNSTAALQLWQQAIKTDLGVASSFDQQTGSSGITLKYLTNSLNSSESNQPEAYQIQVTGQQILVSANTSAGFFYALQSLRQLWQQQTSLPGMEIRDQPRFAYRGILLDVARHYLTLEQLKNFIDIMAAAKLNTLHLHLSDDEAFRLELADYPELKTSGAQRGFGLANGPMSFPQMNLSKALPSEKVAQADETYAGSYSKNQLRQLISYANLRQITIIPELDIPGHSRALMKALPNSFHESDDQSEYVGYGDDTIPVCAYGSTSELGQNFTTDLMRILYQTAKLFNQQTTQYAESYELSIGGDEVFNGAWDGAPSCQQSPWRSMSALEKEHYFLNLLNNDARINQLRFSGWHELVMTKDGQVNPLHGIKPDNVGHVWVWGKSNEAMNKAVTLSNNNYPVVLDYSDYLYFDMTYSAAFHEPGFYWATKFGDTYAALSAAQSASLTQQKSRQPENIRGLEAALWTDVIPSYAQLQYMALPKLAGLAEAAWSPSDLTAKDNPDWRSLANRLGCGQTGFLAYLNQRFNTIYRGYPNGIKLEAPQVCP